VIDTAEHLWQDAQTADAPQLAALRQKIADLEAAMRATIVARFLGAVSWRGFLARFLGAVERPHTAFDEAMAVNDPTSSLDW
jgi:hypothetical protein